MLKADLKRAYVDALMSGRYKRSRGFLRRNDTYSAIGVLLDVHDPNMWCRIPGESGTFRYGKDITSMLSIVRELGLGWEEETRILEMEDENRSFAEIAEFVERFA